MEPDRLDSIPTSIDFSSFTYKNFDKVLVGSIGREGLEGEAKQHPLDRAEPLSPKIVLVPKRKVVAAKREKDDLVGGAGLEAQTKLHPSSRLQTQLKRRSLTRKTAVVSSFSISPMSAWYVSEFIWLILTISRTDITYPSNARVQVTEADSQSSPRRRTRKVCSR